MATQLKPLTSVQSDAVSLDSFNGGARGPCIQLTHSDMFIQLDKEQATQLIQRLTERFNLS